MNANHHREAIDVICDVQSGRRAVGSMTREEVAAVKRYRTYCTRELARRGVYRAAVTDMVFAACRAMDSDRRSRLERG